jgi:hypothetical protein
LTSRGSFIKNSSWQAKQSIEHTTVTSYGDCVKMCEDFAPNFGDKNWLLHQDDAPSHTSTFTREFWPKATWLLSPAPIHPPFLFPRFKTNQKSRHFDTIEVIESESQVVLNTLTEHDFQNEFKKWHKRWERCIHTEGDYFEGDGGQ